ncbi:MAG TPA: hypothetical protein VLK89_01270 [Solirubrobacterales bacterium]|nr:hypothetical protein [Solirubrobacterales bacterium]
MESDGRKALEEPVFCDGSYKPFGQVTISDARRRAEELGEAGSWGPLAKVAGVANAWRELAAEMERSGVSTVAGLEIESAFGFARRVWVVPPRGSLL